MMTATAGLRAGRQGIRAKLLIVLAMIVGAVVATTVATVQPETAEAGVFFNDVQFTYKEYWADHSTFTAGCGASETPGNSFYIEPEDCTKTINLQIADDTRTAIAAVVYVDLWRNRLNKSARFTINDGPQYRPPEGRNFSRTAFQATVPLTQLRQGANSFKFQEATGPYHVRDVMVRVYYDAANPLVPGPNSDVSPPSGQLVSVQAAGGPVIDPAVGGSLQVDGNQVMLKATAAGGAKYVEFHGYYDGYDEDNDGLTLDWHNFLRNNYGPGGTAAKANGATIGHIGTDATPNAQGQYEATWNLQDVVSQTGVKFKIRVVDAQGNVTEVAGGVSAEFSLDRTYSVEAYTIPNFPDQALHFNGSFPQLASLSIDLPTDLNEVDRVIMLGNYWQNPDISINDTPPFRAYVGAEDTDDTSQREIDPSLIRPGNNTIRWNYRPPGFGAMIEAPGPMFVIHRNVPTGPPVITVQPSDALVSTGQSATFTIAASGEPLLNFQWLRNGAPIIGATSSTYVTPALLGSDDGVKYSVQVTNGQGSATSDEGTAFVASVPDASAPWWDTGWDYRTPLTVFPQGIPRQAKIVEQQVNFSTLMAGAGAGGPTFDANSIRVVELDDAGVVVDAAVPFQFDPSTDYDPISNAVGLLMWQLTGTTEAGEGRSYHVYFDKTYKNIPAATVAPQIVRTNVVDFTYNAYQFDLADGSTWVFHGQDGGGFSKIIDKDGADWIGWNPAPGAQGDFRGTPNAVKPPTGYFHPGRNKKTSTKIIHEGPLRITMEVRAKDNSWISVWEMYPTYGEFTMPRANTRFWYLYEGLPGGEIDADDYIQRSDGVVVPIYGGFESDLPGEEWMYFADPADGRSIFIAHDQDDGAVESYRLLNPEQAVEFQLPVMAFGRGGLGLNEQLLRVVEDGRPQKFTTGLAEGTEFGPTGDLIRGAYRDVRITTGSGEFNGVNTGAISDDFSGATLDPIWTYSDPVGDTTVTLTGSNLLIDIPAGTSHDIWQDRNFGPRLLQDVGDDDLDVVAAFESAPTAEFQGQGLFFVEDENNWVRVFVEHTGVRARFIVYKMVDGVASQVARKNLPGIATRYVRAIRTGDTWSFQRSYNGNRWFPFKNKYTIPLDLQQLGVAAITHNSGTSPAFVANLDYFESKTTGGLNDDAPRITNVNVEATARRAVVSWETNVAADTRLDHGPNIDLGKVEVDPAQTTIHSVEVDYLRCGTPYFVQPRSSSTIASTIGDLVNFSTGPCPTVVSDDFSTGVLGPQWTPVDPVGDTTLTMSPTNAIVSVPAGTDHNLFSGKNLATRLRQEGPIGDFSVDAKFESVLTARFQMQGIVVEEDDDSYLRFEIHHDGTQIRTFMASVLNDVATTYNYGTLPASAEYTLRVGRVGNTWTMYASIDGLNFTTVASMVVGFEAAYVGPYIGTTATGNATPPAFLGSVDYFFNTATPIVPEDGGAGTDVDPPVITAVTTQTGSPTSQSATVTWTTDEPSTTRVDWGTTSAYGIGPLVVNDAVTSHTAVIQPVNCGTNYHYRVQSNDPSGNIGSSPNLTFSTPACPPGPFSDNFDAPTLDSRWFVDDPRGDGSVAFPDGLLSLSVPEAARHDLTQNQNGALRALQPVPNGDFQVMLGFESVVNFNFQLQGLIFEQDDNNLIRFDLSSNGSTTSAFVGTVTTPPARLITKAYVPVQGAVPGALRVTRVGTTWTFEYSPDRRVTWNTVWTGTLDLSVARMGPFVGNANPSVANVPAHTALVDYFWSSSDPIQITEPGALEAPEFTIFGGTGPIWDGNPIRFGGLGMAQPDVNIRGRVSDLDGIASITYRVNGGQPATMGLGTTACAIGNSCTRRLARDGDFNADVNSTLLAPGLNNVTIRAVDNQFNVSEITVPIDYTPGNVWPLPYSVDWSTVADLYDVSQPIDGRWRVDGDHVTVDEVGYDRLLAVGDDSWSSFEAEVPITIRSIDPGGYNEPSGGPGVGFIPHWRGHTQVGTTQPKFGFSNQLGSLMWYRYRDDINGERLEIRDSNAVLVAEDLSGRTLSLNIPYIFKMQAETGGGAGPIYRLKAWEQGTAEPINWDIVTALGPEAPDTGALLLVAHHIDAEFGDLSVREIQATAPTISPAQGTYTGIAKIEMATQTRAGSIHYTLDGSEPTEASPVFTEPFFINESTTVRAKTIRTGFVTSATTQNIYSILQPPDRVDAGLQAIYRFDDDSGTTVADTALTGTPLDLVIEPGSDVTWLPDSDALRINGPSTIRTPIGANSLNTAIQTSQSFTVEAWVDPSTFETGSATIFNIATSTPGAQNLALTQQGRTLDLELRTSGTGNDGSIRNTGSVVQSQLQHVVYLRRPDNQEEVYIDGELAYSTQRGGSLFNWASGYGLSIANSGEGINPWIGDLYLLAVYSDDLTPAQITTNYQSGPYPPPANFAPVINAGTDITLVEGEVAQVNATASDDGNPTPPGVFTTTWTQIAGPATATITSPSTPSTDIVLPIGGSYTFRLVGDDGEKTTTDEMTINVIAAGSQAPAPDITPLSGSYPGSVLLNMSTTVPNGEIRYTIDGSDPTSASDLFISQFPLSASSTVKAQVYRTNLTDSPITVRNYLITPDSRVTDDLIVFYPFNEDSGSTIKDKGPLSGPLNLNIENYGKVTRLASGVRIDEPTRITSIGNATKISNAIKASGEMTAELWVAPADAAQFNSMMLGLSGNSNARNFGIFQEAADLDFYMRSRATNTKGEPPTSADGQAVPQLMHLVFTRSIDGTTTVYVNGFEVSSGAVGNNLGNWVSSHVLHLGGERDGTDNWLGTYYLLAFYDRALTPEDVIQNFAYGDI